MPREGTHPVEMDSPMSGTGRSAPRDRWILHFTHVDNLPAIVAEGRLWCDTLARTRLTATEVGDLEIKAARLRRVVPAGRGGRVGEYVPFYFAPRSPMMYRIACDHRDTVPGRYSGGDRPLVYLVARIGGLIDAGLDWVATDGNAATATTEFSCDLARMDRMIDWALMSAERWNNTESDPDRQRRRMAEFLVYGSVPLSVIHQVGTYSDLYASRTKEILTGHGLASEVYVRPGWYYGYERGR
jgi:hypothetical protein